MSAPGPTRGEWDRAVGHGLKVLRVMRGWSQRVAAEKMNISHVSLGCAERGVRRVSVGELMVYGRVYGFNVGRWLDDFKVVR